MRTPVEAPPAVPVEGPGFNVFEVTGGALVSPPEGILMGVTRHHAARRAGWPRHRRWQARPLSQRVHRLDWALRESGRDGTPVFPDGA